MTTLEEFLTNFHFLRPLWLLALLAIPAIWFLFGNKQQQGNWADVIDAHLLPALLDGQQQQDRKKYWLPISLLAWVLASLSLAGPSWEKQTAPLHKTESAVVILLDLSPSMLSADTQPNRLTRARLKLVDLLRLRNEGYTGLIAYAGSAHVVTPLTDDTSTIQSLLPALHPATMPEAGSRPEDAIELALELFDNGGINRGEILLVTDGLTFTASDNVMQLLNGKPHRLSVLGVGTEEGAPIPLPSGGFLRDHNDTILVPRLEQGPLQSLADHNGGRYSQMRVDDKDLDFLFAPLEKELQMEAETVERQFDLWKDNGYWLLLPLIPLCLFVFRRGFVAVLFIGIIAQPNPAQAFEWNDLWLTKDQQGQRLLQQNDATGAATKFEDQRWKAAAHYNAKEFEQSLKALEGLNTASDHYNRGNALSQLGKLDQALEAYDEALKLDPNLEDAKQNKKLVEKLEELQKQQQQNQDQQSQDNDQQQDHQNQQDQNGQQGQNSAQQNDQQNSDQQNNQDNSDQQQSQDQQSESQQNGDQSNLENDKSHLDHENQKQSEEQQKGSQQEESEEKSEQEQDAQAGQTKEQNQEQAEEEQAKAQSASKADPESNEQQPESDQQAATIAQQSTEEQQQALQKQQELEQWLRKVPDDPSGLLRRKFEYERMINRRERMQAPPDDEMRW
ncbi:MAG: VWA domain-containing protein [Cellvibrionaceae bacterium]